MAQSTLRSSVEESNRISEFIDSGNFLEYFKKNILLEEEFLNSTSELIIEIIIRVIIRVITETEWGKLIRKDSVRDPNSSFPSF